MHIFILLLISLFLVPVFSANADADERITDFNFETGGVHPYSRFTIDLYHDNVVEGPANVEMSNWRNRGIQFSLVWPFRSRGPGISPAAGLSYGRHNFYNNDVYEWDFNEDGEVPEANMTDSASRNRLSVAYLDIPLELQYISSEVRSEQFIITLGVRSGLMINANTRFHSDDHTLKLSTFRNFNRFRVAGYARIGYKRWRVFGQYSYFDMFNHNDSPGVQHYSVGVSMMLW